MSTMKAARLHEIATPFQIDTVPIPEVTGLDVLVRVRACGVVPNLKNVTHHYPEWFPYLPLPELPAIFGLDPAGEIAAVGPDVTALAVGQRVYVNPARGCGSCSKCRMGNLVDCAAFTFGGYFGFGPGSQAVFRRYPDGGFAEYMIAPAHAIAPLTSAVSYEDASHFGYLGTSYAALRRGGAGPDTVALVNGATGTLGVGAVLCALAMGVPKILAVARNHELLDRLAALSPGRIATHSTEDGSTQEWARAQTGGAGPNLIIEALGPGTPPSVTLDAFYSIARGGTIVTIGGMDQNLELSPIWLMVNQLSYLGSAWVTTAQCEEMAGMVQAGTLDLSVYDHVRFDLEHVNDAVEAARSREQGGFTNVVVTV
ncbi:alcohol dehydrogenase catalytic domain-containing protein [Naasia lichenicola]|uniref:Alcohol dehydrogenase n=1 Tax=Naasia lichenicola TaxID=2565933 RepID=A0A4S4FJT2_9MICO|nr:alcohol dehydrogenase catalytic domain-containing protein [Naasia lichenicola]THG30112.1 alcohol dehydrogenase [Naasia lichenicola]